MVVTAWLQEATAAAPDGTTVNGRAGTFTNLGGATGPDCVLEGYLVQTNV